MLNIEESGDGKKSCDWLMWVPWSDPMGPEDGDKENLSCLIHLTPFTKWESSKMNQIQSSTSKRKVCLDC